MAHTIYHQEIPRIRPRSCTALRTSAVGEPIRLPERNIDIKILRYFYWDIFSRNRGMVSRVDQLNYVAYEIVVEYRSVLATR